MIQTLYCVNEYDEDKIYEAICRFMKDLEIEKECKPGMKVVIKPNLVMPKSPQYPVTTHPLIIKAVARYLRVLGVTDICLAESSGGIKNLFGTIPGLEKPQMHYRWPAIEDFSNMLLEISQVINPSLTIIDAIDAMEGNGPTGGTSHPLHMVLAAKDLYTQDFFAAKLMGLDPMDIVMIRQAVEKGLAKPDEMVLYGDPVPTDLTPFQVPDTKKLDFTSNLPGFLKKPFTKVVGRLFKSYPQLNKELCVGCGKCAESCPSHIITITKKKAHFQKKGCISCFCCQEICPMKAITVKKAL